MRERDRDGEQEELTEFETTKTLRTSDLKNEKSHLWLVEKTGLWD